QNGHIEGACTTSGLAYKMKGRVGDSPIIGSGLFIDQKIGGAVATGMGEEVIKTVGSFLIVELMRQGKSPQQACEEAVARILEKNPGKPNFQVAYLA
ncbi:MAG: isoaspartyl peptidase/L-asparaginase, partial [Flavobacteriaceae bacterium]